MRNAKSLHNVEIFLWKGDAVEKKELIDVNFVSRNRYGKAPRKVRCYDAETGEHIADFPSVSDAGRAVGIAWGRNAITRACGVKQHTAYGYRWEYAD